MYFNVGKGQFNVRTADGEQVAYRAIEGRLARIAERTQSFNDGDVHFVEFFIEDDECTYILPVDRSKGTFRSIINSLASVTDFRAVGNIEISIYLDRTSGYNRLSARAGGERLEWLYPLDMIPKKEVFIHEGQEYTNTRVRDAFYDYLLAKVTAAVDGETVPVPIWLRTPDTEKAPITPPPPAPAAQPSAPVQRRRREQQKQAPQPSGTGYQGYASPDNSPEEIDEDPVFKEF